MINHLILGLIQGIFEWIPISSEGILSLTSKYLLKVPNPIDLAIFLHLGTTFSAIFYFRKKWKDVILYRDKNLTKFLIISTIFSLFVGFFLYGLVKRMIIGTSLLFITGIGLLFTSFFQRKRKFINLNITKSAIFCGILQALSVIPGLSRSGITVFGLSLSERNPEKILTYSYMMSVPTLLAGNFYLILKNPILVSKENLFSFFVSFFTGLLFLKYLISLSRRFNFSRLTLIFGILCILGAVILNFV